MRAVARGGSRIAKPVGKLMQAHKAQQAIMDKINDSSALFSQGYYILYFVSQKDGEIYVYDTREPMRGIQDIWRKQPTHEFLRIESYPNETTVRDITRMFRLTREARAKLLPTAESVKIVVTEISSAPAAAAQACASP